jgi:hypothetical protein
VVTRACAGEVEHVSHADCGKTGFFHQLANSGFLETFAKIGFPARQRPSGALPTDQQNSSAKLTDNGRALFQSVSSIRFVPLIANALCLSDNAPRAWLDL